MENGKKYGPVIILASNKQQAADIRKMSTYYLGKMPPSPQVYGNVEDYPCEFDVSERFHIRPKIHSIEMLLYFV